MGNGLPIIASRPRCHGGGGGGRQDRSAFRPRQCRRLREKVVWAFNNPRRMRRWAHTRGLSMNENIHPRRLFDADVHLRDRVEAWSSPYSAARADRFLNGSDFRLFDQTVEVVAVVARPVRTGKLSQLVKPNEIHAIRDFFDAAKLQTLALLHDPHELSRLHEGCMSAGVEPGVPPSGTTLSSP